MLRLLRRRSLPPLVAPLLEPHLAGVLSTLRQLFPPAAACLAHARAQGGAGAPGAAYDAGSESDDEDDLQGVARIPVLPTSGGRHMSPLETHGSLSNTWLPFKHTAPFQTHASLYYTWLPLKYASPFTANVSVSNILCSQSLTGTTIPTRTGASC